MILRSISEAAEVSDENDLDVFYKRSGKIWVDVISLDRKDSKEIMTMPWKNVEANLCADMGDSHDSSNIQSLSSLKINCGADSNQENMRI